MQMFKKLIAVITLASVVLTMTACHKKDEVAVTVDGVNITSALYMYALIESDMAAKQKIDKEQAENTESSQSSTTIDYYSQTIDGKSFSDYVKAEALDRCKEYAYYQKLVDNKTITLTDDEKSEAEQYANAYWSYYGYSELYEPNGVSSETYKKAFTYSYYANNYFKKLYGEGGSKAVDKATITKTMNDKYILVYTLSNTYDEDASDEDKATLKTKYQGYADRLAKGEKYSVIYEEINGKSEDADVSESGTSEDSDTPKPKDENATIIGDEDTGYANDDYAAVDKLNVNETKLIENEDKTGFTVYQKLDIASDPYYLTALTDDILFVLKNDEFTSDIETAAGKLEFKENTFATNRFKVKNIVYPETQQ